MYAFHFGRSARTMFDHICENKLSIILEAANSHYSPWGLLDRSFLVALHNLNVGIKSAC
jgi:hypothetical protein